jgi:hypothetical protein
LIEALNGEKVSGETEGEKILPLFFCFDEVSNKIREADLKRAAPFYAFKLDMMAERLMVTDMAAELRKSLDDIGGET